MKGPHVCLFCGTARINLKIFNPSKNEWFDSNGTRKKNADKWFEIDGIRFVRMNTTPENDKIEYENLYKPKNRNVPILVSIDDLKLKKPIQIVGRHMDDPYREFEGNPNPNYITDTGAKALLLDAIAANPSQQNIIEKIWRKYSGHSLR